MRKVRGAILIAVGLVAVFAAAGLYAAYDHQDDVAGQNALLLMEQLAQEVQHRKDMSNYENAVQEEIPVGAMPKAELAGYIVVGSIRVPGLGLELPVQNTWNYDLLNVSPCRYSGSVEGNDLILLGHNYRNHFEPLYRIKDGDKVELCDINGTVYQYEVIGTEILGKTELDRLTGTGHDLTIFTCTTSGYSRFVVRCDRTE